MINRRTSPSKWSIEPCRLMRWQLPRIPCFGIQQTQYDQQQHVANSAETEDTQRNEHKEEQHERPRLLLRSDSKCMHEHDACCDDAQTAKWEHEHSRDRIRQELIPESVPIDIH